jgi:mannitol-1-/sugar-/sorbitol-6-phosphatase
MPIFICSAILFDLDGVLVDSTKSVDRQWRRWASEQGLDPEQVVANAHGVRTVEVIRTFAPHLSAEEETVKLEAREADDRDGVEVMAGAADLLRSLPQGRWCVVTSGTRKLATSRLQLARLPMPEVLVSADDVKNGKPDPEPYLKGAELLAAKPSACLVIEDAPAGIRSAHAGGMKAIALPSTYPESKLLEADAIAGNLAQIQVRVKDGELEVSV